MALFAQLGPPTLGIVNNAATQPRLRRIDGGTGAREAQPQDAVAPGAGGDRQRLATPGVELADRLFLVDLETQRTFGHRARQDLQRNVDQDAERAERTGED